MIMAEADEPVKLGLGIDVSVGRGTGGAVEDVGHKFVMRPIPSVPDTSRLGGAAQSLRNTNSSSSPVTRPDFVRPSWLARRQLRADSGREDNSSITMTDHSSFKEDVTGGPSSTSAADRPAPMSNALDRREDLAQLARKAAFMYGGPLQALRANVARSSALADEAQLGTLQSRLALGAEPTLSHGAGTSGSPVSFSSRMMKGNSRVENIGVPSPLRQQQQQLQQNIPIQAAVVAAGPGPETEKRSCSAQLTIFYAGMVNVYEDVPSDKAQAIMLLAGTGSAWSSANYTNGSSGANPARPSSAGGTNHRPMSRVGSPVPPPEPPSGGSSKLPHRQVTTAVELPQARKASLARFLEKRKDRVRKGPYTHPNGDPAKETNSRENSPSHSADTSSGKMLPPRRSLSPPGASGSEPSSQPRTPPRLSTSSELESHGKECKN